MRLRTGHTPDSWRDCGPATPYQPQRHLSGSLVVSGKATGPVMGFWRVQSPKSADELAASKRAFVGHLTGKR